MFSCTTLVDALQKRAELCGDRPAFIFRDQHGGRSLLTYRRLYTLGGRFAAVLRAGSLGQGQLVVNTLPNSPERVVAEAGILLSGAASVNGQCQLADGSDLLHVLRVSRARAIVLDPDVPNSPWNVLEKRVQTVEGGGVTSSDLPHLRRVFLVRRREKGADDDFLGHLDNLSDCFQADVTPDDVMSVFTTSGSTGFSKLVVQTHGRFVDTCLLKNPFVDETTHSIEFIMAPLGWLGGYPGHTVINGNTRVLCDVRAAGFPKDAAVFAWSAVQEEKCDMVLLLPVLLRRVAETAERRRQKGTEGGGDLAEWTWTPEKLILGGMPITRVMVRSALSLAKSVIVIYGATDFSVVSAAVVDDPDDFRDHDGGPVLANVEVRIVDPGDESVDLPTGQVGSILVRRSGMMREYLNNPEATAAAFTPDGFFRTGDLGSLDERGHVIVAGRGSDAIMRGPYIFYPAWLEARMSACPGVQDVLVVGVPDPFLHQELCACLILASERVTPQHVREFVERDIVTTEDDPMSPRPRYYLRFESFPMTDTDKPRRHMVREQATAMLAKREVTQ